MINLENCIDYLQSSGSFYKLDTNFDLNVLDFQIKSNQTFHHPDYNNQILLQLIINRNSNRYNTRHYLDLIFPTYDKHHLKQQFFQLHSLFYTQD
ncbi:unnamed protein product [Paramecium octaurelia]|uniref:Uncharacterized protein n=1 Tax=Paramecium octaurelia TaxID=43137 RepID=A0A8S1Y114_PAROT|nr:unnamed protein product [Paramecium octaurelia]